MSIVGKAICFTGTLNAKRADASRLAVSAGASVTKSVTKKTQILVCGDGVGATKINAATAKGVEIWTEDKFNAAVVAALASASNAADSDEDEEEDEPAPAPARRTRASKRKAAATAAPKVKKPTAAEKRKAAAATAKSKKQAAAAAKQKKAPARRTRAKTAQASEDDDSDADDDTDPAPAKKKRARKSRPAGLAGVAAPVLGTSTASKAEVNEGLAQKDARLAKHASIYGEYEAKLAQVVKRSNTDKYYIMQLLVDGGDGGYYVWCRWGRTGTSGSGQLTGPLDEPDEAIAQFEKVYKTKTGNTWANRKVGGKAKASKYAHLVTSTGNSRGQWQYYTSNDPCGKVDGWYDYDDEANKNTEELYHDMQNNPTMTTRFIFAESNGFTYKVDLEAGTQTNTSSGTSRPIRRSLGAASQGSTAPAAAAPVRSVKKSVVVPAPGPAPAPAPVSKKRVAKAQRSVKAAAAHASAAAASAAAAIGGIDVDEHAPSTIQSGSVLNDYDAMLNQTNVVGANNNKFIKTQIVRAGAFQFYHWKRWGRVGVRGQTKLDGPFDEDAAIKSFEKYFKSKTGNAWENRHNFVNKANKYIFVEIEHDAAKAQAQAQANAALVDSDDDDSGTAPSTLDPTTQSLIALLFNEDVFKSAMVKMNLDPRKLPLGALSQRQLDKGEQALQDIEDAINSNAGMTVLGRLTGVFYATIPHNFGRSAGPVINDIDVVKAKYDMINTLRDIDAAQQMARNRGTRKKVKGAQKEHPLDAKYRQLNTDLSLVSKSDPDFEIVENYMRATSVDPSGGYLARGGKNKLRHVWRVDRHGSAARFKKHDGMDNRHLLWHGTNVAVVAAILKSGLRIFPHSGGRVGRGIYLADSQAKSANYCSPSYNGNHRRCLMFLVEAPVGREHYVTQDGPHASQLTAPPAGFDSVVAKGKFSPDGEWNGSDTHAELVLDGNKVKVPQSALKKTGVNSTFHHNEILVYSEDRARIRYVLEFDW